MKKEILFLVLLILALPLMGQGVGGKAGIGGKASIGGGTAAAPTPWSIQVAATAHSTHNSASSAATTYGAAIASGSLLILEITWNGSTVTMSGGCTDSVNGSWTAVPGSIGINSGQISGEVFYFDGSAAGTPTVTCTPSSSDTMEMSIFSYTGGTVVGSPVDGSSSNNGFSTMPSTGNVVMAATNDLMFVYIADTSNNDNTVTNVNFTNRLSFANAYYENLFDYGSASGTINVASSITGQSWIAGGVAFKSQ